MDRYFGSSPTFVLDRPLAVKKTNWIAITVPTWAPMFAEQPHAHGLVARLARQGQLRGAALAAPVRDDRAAPGERVRLHVQWRQAALHGHVRARTIAPDGASRAAASIGGVTTEGWIFMVGFRVFDVGLLIVWLDLVLPSARRRRRLARRRRRRRRGPAAEPGQGRSGRRRHPAAAGPLLAGPRARPLARRSRAPRPQARSRATAAPPAAVPGQAAARRRCPRTAPRPASRRRPGSRRRTPRSAPPGCRRAAACRCRACPAGGSASGAVVPPLVRRGAGWSRSRWPAVVGRRSRWAWSRSSCLRDRQLGRRSSAARPSGGSSSPPQPRRPRRRSTQQQDDDARTRDQRSTAGQAAAAVRAVVQVLLDELLERAAAQPQVLHRPGQVAGRRAPAAARRRRPRTPRRSRGPRSACPGSASRMTSRSDAGAQAILLALGHRRGQ